MQQDTRFIVGCMTGTSLDGLDAALVALTGRGVDARARFVGMTSLSLGALRDELKHFAQGRPAEPIRFLRAARRLGELHAEAVLSLCRELGVAGTADGKPSLDFVVAHGQTIWHAPGEKLSWQLMDPWPIVRTVGVPVLYDLRQADLIAGGQGAPITPASDWMMYRSAQKSRLIVNLGGICNVTVLRAGESLAQTAGGDIGPCNLLIDGLVQRIDPSLTFDADGRLARRGRALAAFTELARRESPFFSRPIPRTTGREDFDAGWLDRVRLGANQLRHEGGGTMNDFDVLASAVDFVAVNIAEYVGARVPGAEIVLAGGGARNGYLVERIAHHCGKLSPASPVLLSDSLGVPVEAREAMGFAVLGALSQDGVAITIPGVTGAHSPGVAGVWAGRC